MKRFMMTVGFVLCVECSVLAQTELYLMEANYSDSNNSYQVVWETDPGVRYELQQTATLTNWATVLGYPAEAAQYADVHAFNTTNNAQFFRVVQYDEQAPAITDRLPGDGAFAIARFSSISLRLSDVSGVDLDSISMTVGDLGRYTLADTQLVYTNGLLTFNNLIFTLKWFGRPRRGGISVLKNQV
ncbi:MAG: hypothetical protein JXR40_13685 [Pontiellaceae bacterium]|nr:hypothetical protein [Pontiellaceae bacterium]